MPIQEIAHLEKICADAGYGVKTSAGQTVRALELRLREVMLHGGGRNMYMTEIAKACGARPPYVGEKEHDGTGIRSADWNAVYTLFRECRFQERMKALYGLVLLPKIVGPVSKGDPSNRVVGKVLEGSLAAAAGVKPGMVFVGFEELYNFPDGSVSPAFLVMVRQANGQWEAVALPSEMPSPTAELRAVKVSKIWDHQGLKPKISKPKASIDSYLETIEDDLSDYDNIVLD